MLFQNAIWVLLVFQGEIWAGGSKGLEPGGWGAGRSRSRSCSAQARWLAGSRAEPPWAEPPAWTRAAACVWGSSRTEARAAGRCAMAVQSVGGRAAPARAPRKASLAILKTTQQSPAGQAGVATHCEVDLAATHDVIQERVDPMDLPDKQCISQFYGRAQLVFCCHPPGTTSLAKAVCPGRGEGGGNKAGSSWQLRCPPGAKAREQVPQRVPGTQPEAQVSLPHHKGRASIPASPPGLLLPALRRTPSSTGAKNSPPPPLRGPPSSPSGQGE